MLSLAGLMMFGCKDDACEEENHAPVVFDQEFTTDENTPNGTVVGKVQAQDPENVSLLYSITNQHPAAAFIIDETSGELKVADSGLLDYETNPKFNIVVQVVESDAKAQQSSSSVVVVNLRDVAEATNGTVEFKPDATTGKDATVWDIQPANNYSTHPQILGSAGTFNGSPAVLRSLFDFDLSSIPAEAHIESATLYLYHHEANNNFGHQGQNEGVIKRITQSWSENTVTWNTQPGSTTLNQVSIPASTSTTQNYEIDMTALVRDARQNAGSSFGYMIQQKVESSYRSLVFASSDVADDSKRPRLVVTYTTE